MGTRNLTVVILEGEVKVAQYCQWDGYPSGQGVTILNFLRARKSLKNFKAKVSKLKFINESDMDSYVDGDNIPEQFSRNTGGDILNLIFKGKIIDNSLYNSIEFSGDSLMCEYAYVIDLDKNTFEAYEGFNKTPLNESDRFFQYTEVMEHREEQYHPVVLVKSYSLDSLPTKKTFLRNMEGSVK